MKRFVLIILGVFLVAGTIHALPNPAPGHGQGKYGLFYGSLAAHGEWIEMGFGTVWRPFHVGHAWRPYMNGRWIWTDYGWYWQSYEPFGWATYHYGRWIYDDYYGWIWVPDDVWGPAWVEWRYGDDYVGWAPLPPYATFSVSIGLTFGRAWVAPVHYWSFVPCGNFAAVHVGNYVRPASEARRIYGWTRAGGAVRAVDRRIVNDGVGLDRIERRAKEPIRRVDLVDRATPGDENLVTRNDRGRMEVYRPGPEEVRRERTGQRTQEQVQKERTGQRTQEQVQRERTGQRTQEQVQKERTGQRTMEQEMREKVTKRDLQRDSRQKGVEKPKPEVKRAPPAPARPKPEVRRSKPDGRSGAGR